MKKDDSLVFSKSDYVYQTEINYHISSICSTGERRIFLGSQNDYLYELDYKFTDFFGFNRKARKITHSSQSFFKKIIPNIFNLAKRNYIAKIVVDNTRHLLYALFFYTNDDNIYDLEKVYHTEIAIYDLGENGLEFHRIGEIDLNVIKERYFELNNFTRNDNNFNFIDMFPITRNESRVYNLIIITKNGIRAYISFDTILSDRQVIQNTSGIIYRYRPQMKYSMLLKHFPEPTSTTIIENNDSYSPNQKIVFKTFQKYFFFTRIFHIDGGFAIYYRDEYNRMSYLDIIEYEDTKSIKNEQTIGKDSGNKEITSPLLKLEYSQEIFNLQKVYGRLNSENYNLLKLIIYENQIPKNINYLDSSEHYSYTCMHRFARQLFIPPDQYVTTTSSELIFLKKLRPIDLLFKVIHEESTLVGFIAEFGIFETATMLLSIIVNKAYIFYTIENEKTIEHRNTYGIIGKATEHFINLIDKSFKSMLPESSIKGAFDTQSRRTISYIPKANSEISKLGTSIYGQPITETKIEKMNCNNT
jgi:hypothetical protein